MAEQGYLMPRVPLVMSTKKRKVEASKSTDGQESEPSAFNCVSVVNLKKEGKKMYRSLDEVLRECEEKRKKRDQYIRWMVGLPGPDQQDNSSCNKKSSREDMLWFIKNQNKKEG